MMEVLNRLKYKKRHEFAFYIKFAIIRIGNYRWYKRGLVF